MTEPASVSQLSFNRVAPIFALTFVDVLGLTLILPLLHLYALAFGASPLEIGLTAAAFPLAQLIGVPVMGALSDRFGRKPLLLISQVTTCASFIMLATANSLAMVIFSRVFDGLFGANLATAQAAISDVTTAENRARGLGLTGAAFGLGFMLGPAISAIALEFTDSLSVPAWIAAAYSALSILLTLFIFQETLPPANRRAAQRPVLLRALPLIRLPQVAFLLLLMFAQQVIFYGFETLLGLFALSRIGLLGQGIGFVFVFVGVVLVWSQVRLIGRLTTRYGEAKVASAALLLLGFGLLLLAATPVEPHPFYVRQILENEIAQLAPSGTEAVIGDIQVELPPNAVGGGLGGILWLLSALVVIAVGAGLIRPSLNSLMTRRVAATDYGAILGLSAGAVSAANAIAPLLGGFAFQGWGASAPFVVGGVGMLALGMLSVGVLRSRYTSEAP